MAKQRRAERAGDSVNVTRIEHENLESAVQQNARRLERLDARLDALARDVAELKKLIRSRGGQT